LHYDKGNCHQLPTEGKEVKGLQRLREARAERGIFVYLTFTSLKIYFNLFKNYLFLYILNILIYFNLFKKQTSKQTFYSVTDIHLAEAGRLQQQQVNTAESRNCKTWEEVVFLARH